MEGTSLLLTETLLYERLRQCERLGSCVATAALTPLLLTETLRERRDGNRHRRVDSPHADGFC